MLWSLTCRYICSRELKMQKCVNATMLKRKNVTMWTCKKTKMWKCGVYNATMRQCENVCNWVNDSQFVHTWLNWDAPDEDALAEKYCVNFHALSVVLSEWDNFAYRFQRMSTFDSQFSYRDVPTYLPSPFETFCPHITSQSPCAKAFSEPRVGTFKTFGCAACDR